MILDDRNERPGVKFADAELVGIPFRLAVGPRGLENGIVEWKSRSGDGAADVPVAEAVSHVATAVENARAALL